MAWVGGRQLQPAPGRAGCQASSVNLQETPGTQPGVPSRGQWGDPLANGQSFQGTAVSWGSDRRCLIQGATPGGLLLSGLPPGWPPRGGHISPRCVESLSTGSQSRPYPLAEGDTCSLGSPLTCRHDPSAGGNGRNVQSGHCNPIWSSQTWGGAVLHWDRPY